MDASANVPLEDGYEARAAQASKIHADARQTLVALDYFDAPLLTSTEYAAARDKIVLKARAEIAAMSK